MKKTTEVTDIHIRELLAFELHRAGLPLPLDEPDGPSEPAPHSEEYAAETWRNLSISARAALRLKAETVMRNLEVYGISLRASNSRKVLDTLERVTTIPARPAYDLAEATETIKTK